MPRTVTPDQLASAAMAGAEVQRRNGKAVVMMEIGTLESIIRKSIAEALRPLIGNNSDVAEEHSQLAKKAVDEHAAAARAAAEEHKAVVAQSAKESIDVLKKTHEDLLGKVKASIPKIDAASPADVRELAARFDKQMQDMQACVDECVRQIARLETQSQKQMQALVSAINDGLAALDKDFPTFVFDIERDQRGISQVTATPIV